MASLDDLLALQEIDTRVDQLRHARESLAEREELKRLAAERAEAVERQEGVAAQIYSTKSALKEAEDHASLLEDKAAVVNSALYDGSVTAHKELEAMQAEIVQLKSQQFGYEETALELMEEIDRLEAALAEHNAEITAIDAKVDETTARLVVAETELDIEIERGEAERSPTAAAIPEDMLAHYDLLRRRPGGVAVAAIVTGRCGGCHLEIPSAELEQIRRSEDFRTSVCPECGCLLAH